MDSKVIVAVVVLLSSFDLVQGKNHLISQEGDFIIGQLLSMRKDSGRRKCADLDLETIIEVEAMVYSANKLNDENAKLRVGYDIIACTNSSEGQIRFATGKWFKKGGNISRVPVAIIADLDENDYISMSTDVKDSGNVLP